MSTLEVPGKVTVDAPVRDGVYPFGFDYAGQGGLYVAFVDADGAATELLLNTDYIVSPAVTYGGGCVTLMADPPADAVLVIGRSTGTEQEPSLKATEKPIERLLEKLTYLAQDLALRASFTVSRRALLVGLAPALGAILTNGRPQSLAGMRSAADKTQQDGLRNEMVTVDPGSFDSRAQIAATEIAAAVQQARAAGHTAAGDAGAILVYTRVASEPGHAGKVRSLDRYRADGVIDLVNGGWWELMPSIAGIPAGAFGVDMTGNSFSDAAWADLLSYAIANRTSPTYKSGWGQAKILLPKGKLKLQSTYAPGASVIGLTIEGAAKYATAIEFHNDADPMFDLTTNIATTFRHMTISHVAQDEDRATWTNSIVTRTGSGGGNQLHFDNVTTINFAVIDRNTGSTDNDTTRFTFCRLDNPRVVIHGRSSQALVNKFEHTSIIGKVERILDVAGYGYTVFDACNLVVDGAWIHLADVAGLYGETATIVVRDTKGEPFNSNSAAGGSISQLIVVENGSAHVMADIAFENVGFNSATSLDPSVPQIDVTTGVRLRWRGGNIQSTARIRTTATTTETPAQKAGIVFEDLRACPLPSAVTRVGNVGEGQPSITWKNCRGVPNLTAGAPRAIAYIRDAEQVNHLTSTVHGLLVTSTAALELPFYGFRQRIKEVLLHLDAKAGNDLTVDVYSDAARSALIGTIALTNANNTARPLVRRLSAAEDVYVTEGLYFDLAATIAHTGHIQVTHVAS